MPLKVIISIIINAPKQIDLQVFLLPQLPYCVIILLLTSRCKSAAAQYKRIINWHLHEVF